MTTLAQLRQISRELYRERRPTFASAKPLVRPSDYFARYSKITFTPRLMNRASK